MVFGDTAVVGAFALVLLPKGFCKKKYTLDVSVLFISESDCILIHCDTNKMLKLK